MDEDEDEAEVGMGRLAMYICYALEQHIVVRMEFFERGDHYLWPKMNVSTKN